MCLNDAQNQRHVFANPSPEGRGCREAAGEGYKNEKALNKWLLYPSPDPLARATLSLRERDLRECIFQFGQHSLAGGQSAKFQSGSPPKRISD